MNHNPRAIFGLLILLILPLMTLGCGQSADIPSKGMTEASSNPIPQVSSISPSQVTAGAGTQTLTVNGSNFVEGASVLWNGNTLAATFVNSSQLTTEIPSSALMEAGTAQVQVFNPKPGGGSSNIQVFTILNPLPQASSATPNSIRQGTAAFTLTITGSGFVSGSTIRWNGETLTTEVINGQTVSATVPGAASVNPGMYEVKVSNPEPGGGISEPLMVTVQPVITKFAYASLPARNQIAIVGVDTTSGTMTDVGTVATGNGTYYMKMDREKRFLYAANIDDNTISAYRVSDTGLLTEVEGSPFPVGEYPVMMEVGLSNKHLYVANYVSNNISVLEIDSETGALTPVTGSPFAAGEGVWAVSFDPAGKFAYAANYDAGTVTVYTVNQETGALQEVPGSTVPFITGPTNVVVEPNGKFAYVLGFDTGVIDVFAINQETGVLTALPAQSLITQGFPHDMVFSMDGKLAYAVNYESLLAFAVNQETGELAPLPGSPMQPVTLTSSVALSMNGKVLMVTGFFSNSLAMFDVNAESGEVTLLGRKTVVFNVPYGPWQVVLYEVPQP